MSHVTSFWQVIEKSRIEFRVRARAETNIGRNFGHATTFLPTFFRFKDLDEKNLVILLCPHLVSHFFFYL